MVISQFTFSSRSIQRIHSGIYDKDVGKRKLKVRKCVRDRLFKLKWSQAKDGNQS